MLPAFCAPAQPTALSSSGTPETLSVFNLNVAEGAGVDRSLLTEKGRAVAAVVAEGGYDLACLQEVWDEGERAALVEDLGAAGLVHHVEQRLAGLVIASRHPIVRCASAPFETESFGATLEAFTGKGVLGALVDVGGGALVYAFVTHMAAFSDNSGSAVQLTNIRDLMNQAVSEAAGVYQAERIGVVLMGDMNLNAGRAEDYQVLIDGLGGSTAVRDLHVEEHGDWSTWRNNTDVIGMSMVCAPGAELSWGNFSAGTCPDSGVMERPPSLLDYIIAIDSLPDHALGSLATLEATENEVLSHRSDEYTWLGYGADMTSDSLSDHQARAVVLHHPYVLPPAPPNMASSEAVARAAVGWLAPLLAACALL